MTCIADGLPQAGGHNITRGGEEPPISEFCFRVLVLCVR